MADATPGFWITNGWVSRAELYTDGKQVTGFPTQSDMTNGRVWIRPGNTADVVSPAKFVDTPSGQRFAYGGLTFTWEMPNLSPKMSQYIQETFFTPGSTPSNFFHRAWSNKVTVQTYNRLSGEWETYQCYGKFANPASEAEPSAGGYNNLQLIYTAYKVAPDGPDIEVVTSSAITDIYNNTDYTFSITMNNIGDYQTLDDITVIYTIPSNFDYVSATSLGTIAIEYSTDGGSNYSGTPPGALGDVTNIRITYSDIVDSNGSAEDIDIILTPTAVSSSNSSVVSISTPGDQDNTNDTDTQSLDILTWSPLALTGLEVWLDASVDAFSDVGGTTPSANTDPVARWDDQSGNSHVFLQATGANQPTYDTNSGSGPNSVLFNLTDFLLEASVTIASNPWTISIVVDATDDGATADYQQLMELNDGANVWGLWHIDNEAGNLDQVASSYNGTWYKYLAATTGMKIYTFFNSSGANKNYLYIDDTQSGSTYTGGESAINGDIVIGADSTGTYGFNGKIHEIVYTKDELSGQDLDNLIAYLNTKYTVF